MKKITRSNNKSRVNSYEMAQQKTISSIIPQPPQAQSQVSRQIPKGSAIDSIRVPTHEQITTTNTTEPTIIKTFGIRLELNTASATGNSSRSSVSKVVDATSWLGFARVSLLSRMRYVKKIMRHAFIVNSPFYHRRIEQCERVKCNWKLPVASEPISVIKLYLLFLSYFLLADG